MNNIARRSVEVVQVTDQQRAKLYELIAEDPWRGHIKAARQAGIEGMRGQLTAWLKADEGFQEFLHTARGDLLDQAGLSVPHLFTKLASVVNDDGHSSQLRAITEALAIRGISGRQRVEITGEDGGAVEVTNPDVAAAIERFTSTVVRLAARGPEELPPGPTSG